MVSKNNIIIAVHSLFDHNDQPISGTGASLFELLRKGKTQFSVFHLPIYGNHRTLIQTHTSHSDSVDRHIFMPTSFMLRTFIEACVMLRAICSSPKISVYIGIDPLNALWGIIGKYIFRKIDYVIFYTADYSPNRFKNILLNLIYHGIDRLCIAYADQVWSVSTRIHQLRSAQGVQGHKSYFIPNSPIVLGRHNGKRHRNWITIVGTSTTALDYDIVMRALPAMVHKYPKIHLNVIGELHFNLALQKKLKIWEQKKIISMLGPLSREKVHSILAQSGIGLALYTNKDPWTQFGDSMKVREYLAAGLPVIMTNNVSTSDVIGDYKCGKIIALTEGELLHAINSIYAGMYDHMSEQAFAAAQNFSYDRMVRQPLSEVGITV